MTRKLNVIATYISEEQLQELLDGEAEYVRLAGGGNVDYVSVAVDDEKAEDFESPV